MKRLTKSWRLLVEEVQEAATGDLWEPINHNTIRYAEWSLPTPEGIPSNWWPEETFSRFVFLTILPGSAVILGVAPAPWVGRRDQVITQKRTREILNNPAQLFVTKPTRDLV